MAARTKKQFRVYKYRRTLDENYGDGPTTRSVAGDTWAVSAAQACSFVAHRHGDRVKDLIETGSYTCVAVWYEAEAV